MSDELVKRTYHRGARDFGTGYDMMARIIELEAALAKADAVADDLESLMNEAEVYERFNLLEDRVNLAAYREARKLDA